MINIKGTHESLRGNPLALATVTAIIDGTGSIGLYSIDIDYCVVILPQPGV